MHDIRRRAPFVLVVTALLVAACSSSGSDASAPPPSEAAPATRIEVTLTDAFKMDPEAMTVPAGVPVTFIVTNTGTLEHEFYLGDEATQAAHEEEMAGMGGMSHGDPKGIAVAPGETKELTYTFQDAGSTLAGCHVPGHYGAGMTAVITVVD